MSDGDEPLRPRPHVPGKPLPRTWKSEPEPEPEEDRPATKRKSRQALEKEEKEQAEKPQAKGTQRKSSKGPDGAKSKSVLLEETPGLDTYQSRKRARLLLGGLIAATTLVGLVFLYRSFQRPTIDDEGVIDEGSAAVDSPGRLPPGPDSFEAEAKNLLATARQLAKNGKTKEATVILQRLVKSYPKTAAAVAAKEAIDRPAQNLPMFVDEEMVVASATTKARPSGAPSVSAIDAGAAVVSPDMSGNATLQLNPNPAEAPRAPSDRTEAKPAVPARSLPAGFRIEPESGVHASGWPYQIVSDRDGSVMVLVPAATFIQGRDDGPPDEGPAHKVKLGAFYIDQHEATIRQYDLYLKETGRRRVPARTATKDEPAAPRRTDDDPATNITALEAKAYCEWAGKQLPTEAQWEAAARSTDGRLHPWGSSDPVWSRPRTPRQIDPVGSYPLDQSPYGALDLSGNAWEWTRDWFDSKYYQQFKGQTVENPTGPLTSRARPPQVVVKGGSKSWGVAWREGLKVETKLPYVGFRGVLPLEASTAAAPTQPSPPPGTTPPPNAGGIVPF